MESPDAVMAEICWRATKLFCDADFAKNTKLVEIDDENQETEDLDNIPLLEDFEDSDNDDM